MAVIKAVGLLTEFISLWDLCGIASVVRKSMLPKLLHCFSQIPVLHILVEITSEPLESVFVSLYSLLFTSSFSWIFLQLLQLVGLVDMRLNSDFQTSLDDGFQDKLTPFLTFTMFESSSLNLLMQQILQFYNIQDCSHFLCGITEQDWLYCNLFIPSKGSFYWVCRLCCML